jgi:hypothetical protein
LRKPFNALQETGPTIGHEKQQIARLGRHPLTASCSSQSALKFLAMGDQLAVVFDAEPARPLAPKSCLTYSVNSSIRFRENRAAPPWRPIPRTLPPPAASRNTRNVALRRARSVQSTNSMPKRRSGAS